MAKGDYYFPLYYRRLLSSTIGWKDDEFGAYLRLLIYQFDNGSIPGGMDELSRIAPSIKKHWKLLSKKFEDNGRGGLINLVMDEIYQDVQAKKEVNSKNGKKGGRPGKNKKRIETESKANGFKNETQMKAILITNNQESINTEREAPPEFFTIERCLTVAMDDKRWVKANKTAEAELNEFNSMLERTGVYTKNPMDYKSHFSRWKRKGKLDDKDNISQQETKMVM